MKRSLIIEVEYDETKLSPGEPHRNLYTAFQTYKAVERRLFEHPETKDFPITRWAVRCGEWDQL